MNVKTGTASIVADKSPKLSETNTLICSAAVALSMMI
jgi:hypothetical protein